MLPARRGSRNLETMMKTRRILDSRWSTLLFCVAALSKGGACGSNVVSPAQACRDFITAAYDTYARCNPGPLASTNAATFALGVERAMPGGSCDAIAGAVDGASFDGNCVASILSAPCNRLAETLANPSVCVGRPVNRSDGGTSGRVPIGGPVDAGACAYGPSQTVSQPCCASLGIDACGANLFCAALDGRTMPTCYPERSRSAMTECTADVQCMSNRCSANEGRCRSMRGEECTIAIGCTDPLRPNKGMFCDRDKLTCFEKASEGKLCKNNEECASDVCSLTRGCWECGRTGLCYDRAEECASNTDCTSENPAWGCYGKCS